MAPLSRPSVVALIMCLIVNVSLLSFGHGESSSTLSPDMYWKNLLPNTPIPKTIRESLYHPEWRWESLYLRELYGRIEYKFGNTEAELRDYQNNPGIAVFFLQKNLHAARSKLTLQVTRSEGRQAPILPRKEAAAIPFSSNAFPNILEKFAVSPDSKEAKVMKHSLKSCEDQSGLLDEEERVCSTSLESMVDFVAAKLGRNAKAVATSTVDVRSQRRQAYTVVASKEVGSSSGGDGAVVVCHKLRYPYAVFYCHKLMKIEAYEVSMVGADGGRLKAAAVCHVDTSGWNPNHLAFKVLQVNPGAPVCHFLAEDGILWFRNPN